MNIIDLLKKIEKGEIEDGSMFHGGDLFYCLIVIEKDLYVINDITKNLNLLNSHTIGNFIINDYKIYEYKKVID